MARMKDLLHDLEAYGDLTLDEQKRIREMYNITTQDVAKILSTIHTERGEKVWYYKSYKSS